ncbi:hypothetical protein J2X63_002565 [Agromyces sp. 3263]|uniref:DUF3027 domain-containing protein n=1 Tax=Agromyces sp. 3263 TaxID=2817750 RepID=UPI00285D5623|nr:DUF3027 domain-containing protein [Agromyces sp. 3263]MDR6906879.1 hypothetical protein [Agromyces sp. 3263]
MPEQQGPVDEVDATPIDQPADAAPVSTDEPADAVAVTLDEPADVAVPVFEPDVILLDAVDLARRALLEVTPPETVGSVIGHVAEGEHVLTMLFAADLAGYPGWRWSVTIARVDDGEPTVLETELMPGDTALLAPEWIPWSERLADYRAAQQAAAAAAAEAAGSDDEHDDEEHDDGDDEHDDDFDEDDDLDEDDDSDLDEDDDSDLDDDDDAELDAAFGHDDGDDEFDGIDIDALDESGDDEPTEGDEGQLAEPVS